MKADDDDVYVGESKESFAQAARNAVKEAEKRSENGPPREYEIALLVRATPGSSLSDYIVLAKATG
jgi:hypothetical protein